MALLAEETGLSESSLNRMRWFGYRFSTFDVFRASQPDVTSWEQVCLLLVELSQKEKSDEAARSNSAAQETEPSKEVQTLLRVLKGVAKAVPQKQIPVDEDVFDDIEAGLRKFRRALKKCTGLNVTISIAQASEVVAV